MKKSLAMAFAQIVCFGCLCVTGNASKPTPSYQDATLVSFRNVTTGAHCSTSGTEEASATSSTTAAGTSSSQTNCANSQSRLYTLKVGDGTYVVRAKLSMKGKALAVGTMGWGVLFVKRGVLYGLLPGTALSVRTDPEGFHVKVAGRETLYEIVEAR